MRKLFLPLFLLFATTIKGQENVADSVDMFMGTRANSNCVVGPQMPHGSVNPSPQTPNGGMGGYKEDQPIRGFGQLHVSGSGWTRYGQIFLSPQIGFTADEDGHDSPKADEVAKPYYYKATLTRYGITAELAPSYHSVIYRFTYPPKGKKTILLDLKHNLPQHIVPMVKGKFLGGKVLFTADRKTIVGWGEYAGGFGSGEPYKVYFALQADDNLAAADINSRGNEEMYVRLTLQKNTRATVVRVGVSMRSWKNALVYLQAEVGDKTLEQVSQACKDAWEAQLLRIRIDSKANKRLFYTCLYHSLVMPRDRSNDHPLWEKSPNHVDDHYCVWDTWRTVYPLLTLIDEPFVAKTINSFIDRFRHDSLCTATYTSALECTANQGGDDVDNVIADAIAKHVPGFDPQKAYEVMKWHALHARDKDYRRLGWIPGRHKMMSCSYTMAFAYNDYCTSQVAKAVGDTAFAAAMAHRSRGWEHLFNPSLQSGGFTGFIGPREADGTWITIDPAYRYLSWVEYFYEDNSWAYTCFTPGHIERLIELCGGKEKMAQRLAYGFEQRLIGLNNEPEFLIPFLFNACDRPDLTAKYLARLRNECYSLSKGYIDNEDSGAMGSWYVFTSIGLFPNAGQDTYFLFPPAFDDIVLTMSNGNMLHVTVEKTDKAAQTLSHVSLNGRRLEQLMLRHADIVGGGHLVYHLK